MCKIEAKRHGNGRSTRVEYPSPPNWSGLSASSYCASVVSRSEFEAEMRTTWWGAETCVRHGEGEDVSDVVRSSRRPGALSLEGGASAAAEFPVKGDLGSVVDHGVASQGHT